MISLAVVVGVVVVGAAIVSVCAADGRLVAIAIFAALAASPLLASPLPGALQIAARFVAALLAAYVLWIVMKGGAVRSEGSAIGILAEVAVAAAAYVFGWWIRPVDPLQGPVAEQAAGFALIGLAALPLAGSNVLRAGVGVMLLTLGASFVMDAWLGPAPALVQLGLTTFLLVVPSVVALLVDVEDPIARVIPAVDHVRSETFPAGASVAGRFDGPTIESSTGSDVTADSEAAEVLPTEPATRGRRRQPAATTDESIAAEEGPAVTPRAAQPPAPRPSIRFLGRAAGLRGADSERGSGSRMNRYTRRLGGGQEPDTSHGSGAADSGPADAEREIPGDADSGSAGRDRIRDSRDARNPRFKRPLR
jgi:hypothetical protein